MLLIIAWILIAGFGLHWSLYVVAYIVWVVATIISIPD